MSTYLDIEKWNRRRFFQFFKDYDNPFFNVCAHVDVTALLELARSTKGLSFSLAYHFISIKAANELEPFRYRLRGGRVLIYDRIHVATTVLLDDQRFTFCYFDYEENFGQFQVGARAAIERARAADARLDPRSEQDDMIHYTVLPWVSFTSFSHARRWGTEDSIPKVAFGKYFEEGAAFKMPVSVEVHHSLMDGLDVGRYFELLGTYFSAPSTVLGILPEPT